MHTMLSALLALARAILVPKARLVAENAALRQQLAVYVRTQKRPKLKPADRVFWVFLGRVWSDWARALVDRDRHGETNAGARSLGTTQARCGPATSSPSTPRFSPSCMSSWSWRSRPAESCMRT